MAIEKFSRRKSGFEEVEEDEDFDDLYESDKHTSLGSAYKSGLVETAIFEKADGLVAEGTKSGKIPETAAVVAKMHFYNVLRVGGITDEAMAREVSRINRLSEIEDLYSQPSNPLPTIGIEIEIPGQWLNYEKVEVLDRLKVPNRQELVGGGYLWEVRPDFSYSPLVQSRYLQELVTMEALPLETGKDGELHIKKGEILSLHLNFALPVESGDKTIDIYESEDLNYFSDLVTYAFVSPERLELKKTGWSFDVKLNNVKPTKKMTKADNSTNTLLARIELRATEFGDYTTFRLIAEAQALMATFMSHLKQKYEVSMSDDEKYLALLWPKFLTDIKSLFEKNKVMLNLVDEDRGAAIEILRNKPEFKKECRALMADYSKKVLRRVFKK